MKTICIYHSRDLDGWMSAANVKKWFEKNNAYNVTLDYNSGEEKLAKNNDDTNLLSMLGWDYGDKIPNLSEYDEVIMVDISFPVKDMEQVRQTKEFIWIDHHKSAIDDFPDTTVKGKKDTKFAACELTWQYFFPNETMPEIVRLLGRYDCFGHKGTDEEQKVLEFQYAARATMSNYEDCYEYLNYNLDDMTSGVHSTIVKEFEEKGKAIYKYLCTEAEQIYSRAFPITFQIKKLNKHVGVGIMGYKFLCVNQERFNPINFGIDYHKDGYDGFACFWYKDNKWNFSLYNDNGKVDCSAICKQHGGGGHKGAAGFMIDDINKIIKQ